AKLNGKELIYWQWSERQLPADSICPDLKGQCCYGLTEAFSYSFTTNTSTSLDTLKCSFQE
ncbi:MAG: hypothetical protein AAF551_07535, partial [Bacteroidota bacterium]